MLDTAPPPALRKATEAVKKSQNEQEYLALRRRAAEAEKKLKHSFISNLSASASLREIIHFSTPSPAFRRYRLISSLSAPPEGPAFQAAQRRLWGGVPQRKGGAFPWSFYISDANSAGARPSDSDRVTEERFGDNTSRCLLVAEKRSKILSPRGPLI